MTRNEMMDALYEKNCRVIFTKLNGEQRDMCCTLNMDMIPEDKRPTNGSTEYSADTIRAFDLNKEGWRSFRVDSVISFSYK